MLHQQRLPRVVAHIHQPWSILKATASNLYRSTVFGLANQPRELTILGSCIGSPTSGVALRAFRARDIAFVGVFSSGVTSSEHTVQSEQGEADNMLLMMVLLLLLMWLWLLPSMLMMLQLLVILLRILLLLLLLLLQILSLDQTLPQGAISQHMWLSGGAVAGQLWFSIGAAWCDLIPVG